MGASQGMGDHDFGDRRRRAVAAIVGRHDLVFYFRRRHVIDGWSPLNPRNEKGHLAQFSKQPCSQGLIILVMVPCDRRKRQRTGPSAAATGSRVAVQRRAARRSAGRWFWIWRAGRKFGARPSCRFRAVSFVCQDSTTVDARCHHFVRNGPARSRNSQATLFEE